MAAEAEQALQRVFVVIDPTRLVQPALEKAEWVAERNKALLHLYCCIWQPDVDRESEMVRHNIDRVEAWMQRIATTTRAKGIEVLVEVDWDPDWRERIGHVARASAADLIVKTVNRHSPFRRQLMRTSDWALLRNASCPTLLVDPERPNHPKTVLAAVKLKPGDETHTVLNERVVRLAHRISGALEAELHAVTVYRGDEIYFDRQRFADSCQLPRNRVHAAEGSARRGIADAVKETNADVLIIGCAASSAPERGIIIGDTAQRIIDEVDTDIIVVPAG